MIHGQFQLPEDLMSELEDIDVTLLKVGGWLAFLFFFLSLVLVLPDSSNRGLFHVFVKVPVDCTA